MVIVSNVKTTCTRLIRLIVKHVGQIVISAQKVQESVVIVTGVFITQIALLHCLMAIRSMLTQIVARVKPTVRCVIRILVYV